MKSEKKFMYGIGKVTFGAKTVGYIEKGSWDWGGTKPEKVDVEAEQVPSAPVLTLLQKNGTIAPTFNLIQLDYENLQLALGGELVGGPGAYTGWKAPSSLVELCDKCEIDLVSGQTVRMPKATLVANLGGKLTLTEVSKLECQLSVNMPDDGGAPYEVFDTAPYISVEPASLSFESGGGTKEVSVDASGGWTAGAAPAGFSASKTGKGLSVTAEANTEAEVKSGTITLTLDGGGGKTADIGLSVAAASV